MPINIKKLPQHKFTEDFNRKRQPEITESQKVDQLYFFLKEISPV